MIAARGVESDIGRGVASDIARGVESDSVRGVDSCKGRPELAASIGRTGVRTVGAGTRPAWGALAGPPAGSAGRCAASTIGRGTAAAGRPSTTRAASSSCTSSWRSPN